MRKLAATSFFLLLLVGCTFQSRVIVVTLVNKGLTEAHNIEFRYPGGSFGVSSLAPGKTYDYRIKPFYNGAVEVEYESGSARVHSTAFRVVKDQAGKATVTLGESGVTWDFHPGH